MKIIVVILRQACKAPAKGIEKEKSMDRNALKCECGHRTIGSLDLGWTRLTDRFYERKAIFYSRQTQQLIDKSFLKCGFAVGHKIVRIYFSPRFFALFSLNIELACPKVKREGKEKERAWMHLTSYGSVNGQ